jgi:hypothetical protein
MFWRNILPPSSSSKSKTSNQTLILTFVSSLCAPVEVQQCFGGIYCLHIQGPRARKAIRHFDFLPVCSLCAPVEVQRCFGGTFCLHLQGPRARQAIRHFYLFLLVLSGPLFIPTSETVSIRHSSLCLLLLITYLAYSSILKLEPVSSSETSVNLFQTHGVTSRKTSYSS